MTPAPDNDKPQRKTPVVREEIKEQFTSHWDLDYLPAAEVERQFQQRRREQRIRLLTRGAGFLMMVAIIAVLAIFSGRVSSASVSTSPPASDMRRFVLDTDVIDEASGLARSHRHANLLWVHNDSGAQAELHVIDLQGRHLATVAIDGAGAFDWEDMASFEVNGEPYLLIGDIGDNFGIRRTVSLYLLPEPELPAAALKYQPNASPVQLRVASERKLEFSYEDGARDCESLAVDAANERIYLLSKRDRHPRLYSLPLGPVGAHNATSAASGLESAAASAAAKGDTVMMAQLEGLVTTLPQPTTAERLIPYGRFRAHPTAMDLSRDGTWILLLTYKDAYRFRLAPGQRWAEALAQSPQVYDIPQLKQAEAAAIAWDGTTAFAISEQLPANGVEFSCNCPD